MIFLGRKESREIDSADVVLPVATWAESDGTFTNKQKMVQKINAAFPPPGESLAVWEWVSLLAKAWGNDRRRGG